jgi:hypothetical protein
MAGRQADKAAVNRLRKLPEPGSRLALGGMAVHKHLILIFVVFVVDYSGGAAR